MFFLMLASLCFSYSDISCTSLSSDWSSLCKVIKWNRVKNLIHHWCCLLSKNFCLHCLNFHNFLHIECYHCLHYHQFHLSWFLWVQHSSLQASITFFVVAERDTLIWRTDILHEYIGYIVEDFNSKSYTREQRTPSLFICMVK